MFDRNKIKTCFPGTVGWRESSQVPDCYTALTSLLKQSDSCVFVNSLPNVTLELVNEMVGKDQTDVNTYLTNVAEDAAIDLINAFTVLQRDKLKAKSLLSNHNIGVTPGNIRKLITNKRDRFVGFRIIPRESNSIKIDFPQIGVQFDTLQTTGMKIYFYATTQLTPVAEIELDGTNHTKQSTINWIDLPAAFIANYISETQGSGAEYFIGYYEGGTTSEGDELDGNAIETIRACGSCNGTDKVSKYMHIQPIVIESGDTFPDRTLPDNEDAGATTETFGLHLRVNATCDISEAICENKLLFSNAYQKKQGIRILWDAFNSNELNRITVINEEKARLMSEKLELDLAEELEKIVLDYSNIDSVCLPCKRSGISSVALV